jgi:hypothetical protein
MRKINPFSGLSELTVNFYSVVAAYTSLISFGAWELFVRKLRME